MKPRSTTCTARWILPTADVCPRVTFSRCWRQCPQVRVVALLPIFTLPTPHVAHRWAQPNPSRVHPGAAELRQDDRMLCYCSIPVMLFIFLLFLCSQYMTCRLTRTSRTATSFPWLFQSSQRSTAPRAKKNRGCTWRVRSSLHLGLCSTRPLGTSELMMASLPLTRLQLKHPIRYSSLHPPRQQTQRTTSTCTLLNLSKSNSHFARLSTSRSIHQSIHLLSSKHRWT